MLKSFINLHVIDQKLFVSAISKVPKKALTNYLKNFKISWKLNDFVTNKKFFSVYFRLKQFLPKMPKFFTKMWPKKGFSPIP